MKNQTEHFIETIQALAEMTIAELGFFKGASEEEIEDVEKVTNQELPQAFKLFLSYFNGQNEDFYFLPDQVRLFSCAEIKKEWKSGQEQAEGSSMYYDRYQDNDRIRGTITHYSMIPIAAQEGFGILCIDNDPGPRGNVGQIIYMVDECSFIVLADSFQEFIDLYIDRMQKGILTFEAEAEGFPNLYRLKSSAEHMNGEAFAQIFEA